IMRATLLLATLSQGVAAPATAAVGERQGPQKPKLTLQEAVERALAFHPDLAQARALEEGAAAQVGEAVARRLPQIGARASATRFQEPMIVRPLHGFDIAEPPEFDRTLLQGNLTAALTLFDGGERRARVRGSRATFRAAEVGLDQVSQDLVATVTHRYLAVLGAARLADAHEAGVRALQAESLRVEQLLSEGRAAPVQLLQVSAALAQTQAEGVDVASRLELAELDLARAVGVNVSETRAERLAEVRLTHTARHEDRAAVLARLDGGNLELRKAQLELQAARWNRRAAKSAWLPSLDLTAGYLGFGAAGGDVTGEWQAALRLGYPLFLGGARGARLRRTDWEARAAEQRYLSARLRAEEAADRALSAVARGDAQVVAVEAAVRHLTELVRIEALRVAEGSGTETEFLDAESRLRRARAQLIEARHQAIIARVEVARLTGELSLEWLEATLEEEQ
ncbi:MAG: TolC family protein, partial [Gemmatimonadales bacterium]